MKADTLIIGAGSAGCVLAARLAELSPEQILLVEAGHNSAEKIADLRTLGRIPRHSDWGIFGCTEKAGATLWLPRGRLVGGCSVVQGGIALRSFPEDYELWSRAAGPDWSWESVLPIYRALENDSLAGEFHGTSGPVRIWRPSVSSYQPLDRAFLESCSGLDLPFCADFNAPPASGAGPIPITQTPERRPNVRSWFLDDALARPNLKLASGSRVLRLAIKGRMVAAAQIISGDHSEWMEASRFVLCAGAIGSPEILLRSGIGPADELRRTETPVSTMLNGVGRSLRDHVALWLGFEVGRGQGVPGAPWFQVMLRRRADHTRGVPDFSLEVFHDFRLAPSPAAYRRAVLTLGLLSPSATGSVQLKPAAPEDLPVVRLPFPNPADGESMKPLLDLGSKLLDSAAFRALDPSARMLMTVVSHGGRTERPMARSLPFNGIDAASLDACFTSMHHLHGSCRMGPATDPSSVVDERFRVHGLDNLYVADASVIPIQFRANTHLAALMIGERAAQSLGRQ